LIAEFAPKRVLLIGVAGALSPEWQVGEAVEFGEAVCYGIGAGSGDGFISAREMGWKHWPRGTEIADSIQLADGSHSNGNCLLTCCSASATEQDVRLRLENYPKAIAEDMEGFSVAVACRFAGTPLRIIRGISNLAGDRNKSNWRLRDAMLAVEKTISHEAGI
jgi:futalosine hydrolase